MPAAPNVREDHATQIPALLWLQKLGYEYLPPAAALAARGGKTSGVVLETVLRQQLGRLNAVRRRGQTFDFTPENIDAAVLALRQLPWAQGYGHVAREAYDRLTLGLSLEQDVAGSRKSASLRYIDWHNPASNVYHITAEYTVQRQGRRDTLRPDVVLFVNGLPLAVLECKAPGKGMMGKAVQQHQRNQEPDGIRELYAWSQLLLASDGQQVRYATTDTKTEFWAAWREQPTSPEAGAAWEAELLRLKNQALTTAQAEAVFGSGDFAYARAHFEALAAAPQLVTSQDRDLWSLTYPTRLLELAWHYVLFENSVKKIARYQQFFGVQAIVERVLTRDAAGQRQGGVLWHTQGSGKSLTMVLLAQLLASEPRLTNPKVLLVTDRTDLDEQIEETFKKCKLTPRRATTGRHLLELLRDPRTEVVTTVVHKFETAVKQLNEPLSADDNIFVLVDEGHRTQYGSLHVKMRQVLPHACFVAFTGTPLLKREKSTAARFGGLIEPAYTIRQAVADGAVVPLLYEGRHALQDVAARPLDRFFEVVTEPLTPLQRADLKRKVSRAGQLNEAEQKIQAIALDISEHFHQGWRQPGMKGQLVAPSKDAALRYKEALDSLGKVSSVVLISPPDQREGIEAGGSPATERVQRFWKKMLDEHRNEEQYQKNLINQFKNQDQPDLIIVVDKLLTGFDAPCNTVLYLTRGLREHSLLQAVARVNRVYPGKEFGYVLDYYGNVAQLNDALTTYGGLEGFEPADVAAALGDVRQQVSELPQRHAELWDVFRAITNPYDLEAYRQRLADAPTRHDFYERVAAYTRLLRLAFSTQEFAQRTSPEQLERYRFDGAFFQKLRELARVSYADAVDYRQYETQVQQLIDRHVSTEEVVKLTELVNIFDEERFAEVVESVGGTVAQADTIAHATAAAITERLEEDPALYRRLSELIQETIADYRARRISEAEYLRRARQVQQQVLRRTSADVPAALQRNAPAQAFFGLTKQLLATSSASPEQVQALAVAAGLRLDELLRFHLFDGPRAIVEWHRKDNLVNQARLNLDDYLFDLNQQQQLGLSGEAIDHLLDQVFEVAKRQYA